MIEPMETRYAGCRFRSRTEARWAVFFDQLKIGWEYEPDGFATHAGPYLPDFKVHIPQIKDYGQHYQWFEVKPDGAPDDPRHRALAEESGIPLIIARGLPRSYLSQGHHGGIAAGSGLSVYMPADPYDVAVAITGSRDARQAAFVDSTSRQTQMYCSLGDNRHWCMEDMNNTLRGTARCHLLIDCPDAGDAPLRGGDIDAAYAAARSARFGT